MHRKIDSFTDNHPTVLKSKERLRTKFHKYSPVITDVFYDHFLASNWENYSTESLDIYTQRMYKTLLENIEIFPDKTAKMLPFMIAGDWLFNYKFLYGIEWALKGMARRTKFNSNMEIAHLELKKNKNKYELEFTDFFPDLISYVKSNGVQL